MKWYKHYTDSLDDPFIAELMDEFGHAGYTFYFGLIGIICQQVGQDLDKNFECSDIYLKRKLRISTSKVRLLLDFCQRKGKLIFNFQNKKLEIKIPNIAKIKDNYTKDLQVTGKELSLDKSKSKKKIKSKSKKEPVDQVVEIPTWINIKTWNDFTVMRQSIKKPLNKVAIERIIKKLERFKNEGENIEEVLSTSIENNWAGVFKEKKTYAEQKAAERKTADHERDYGKGIED